MRIDVQKYLFIGLDEDREEFFKKAQQLGFVHFIETHAPGVREVPPEIQQFTNAIKIIRGLPVMQQVGDIDEASAETIVRMIIELKQRIDKLEEERRLLKLEISRIEVFGDFSKDDIRFIHEKTGRILQYFCAKEGIGDEIELSPDLVFVGSEHGLDYFTAINTEPKQYPRMVEIKIERPLGELLARQKMVKEEIALLNEKLKEHAKYNRFLHHAFISRMNGYHLQVAREYARHTLEGSLFAIEGWVPVDKLDKLKELAEQLHVHYEEIEPEPGESRPTYLENRGFARVGEDLVGIYDTPSSTDKDPSLWVFIFFAIFFAMIVNDGGYGFFFLGMMLYLRYKYPHISSLARRIRNLATYLSIACIIWGFLSNSFFGIVLGIDNPLRKISFVQWIIKKQITYHMKQNDSFYQEWIKEAPQLAQAKDAQTFLLDSLHLSKEKEHTILVELADNVLLELALFLGVLHLVLSLLRYIKRNWAAAGWILFMIGGYLYFPYYLSVPSFVNYLLGVSPEMSGHIGLYMIAVGIPLALVLAVIQHGLLGLHEITLVIQIFADTLSYLRLYALALAGGIVANVMNGIAAGLPMIFAVILLLLAHSINMALGIMSGVIHGLRLNFLEWYHYSFEGGGKMFRALKMLNTD